MIISSIYLDNFKEAIPAFILIAPFFIFLHLMVKNTKGAIVEATVKSVERKDQRRKDGSITDVNLIAECEFEYMGEKRTADFSIYYALDANMLKKGDKVTCIYNEKKKRLESQNEAIDTLKFARRVRIFLYFILAIIIFTIFESNVLVGITAFIFWEWFFIPYYDPYKAKGNYIKLKGKVVDIHSYSTGDTVIDTYAPEIEFEYNNKKHRVLSSRFTNMKSFKVGQEVNVYYDPETERIYQKGSNALVIFEMVLGLLMLVICFK